MVGRDVLARYRVVNHTAHDPATVLPAGKARDGETVYLNREYVEADRRIVLGFIEPHFMAGFSGGYKGVFPAVADIASIMRYHDARTIGDPRSTWGLLEGNPTQAIIRHNGSLLPLDFCVNVTLNRRRADHPLLLRPPDRGARGGLRLLEGDGDGGLRAAVPDRGHDQLRLPARPEPVPDGEGDVGGGADRGAGRLHRDRGALQRRLPGARQLQEAALRPRLAACGPRHDRGAGLLPLRPVGGAAPRPHPAEGAGGAPERASSGRRTPCVPRADRRRGGGGWARACAARPRMPRWPCCRRARRRYPT